MDHDEDDRTINRIVCELGYDPDDVCGVRVSAASIEIDFIDFDDDNWPIITRLHARVATRRRSGRSLQRGVFCAHI